MMVVEEVHRRPGQEVGEKFWQAIDKACSRLALCRRPPGAELWLFCKALRKNSGEGRKP